MAVGKNLRERVMSRLEGRANLNAELLESWFEDRFIDLKSHSKSRLSSGLFHSLNEAFEASGLPLNQYTASDE